MQNIEWVLDQVGMRQLEVFYTVAEEESFSRAAERLDLRQPTVSNHVKQLEKLLETPLLLREGSVLKLTRLGELIYRKFRSIEGAREDFRQSVKGFFGDQQGMIRMGASTIPGEVLLPRRLAGFREQFPDVEIDLQINDSSRVIDKVRSGELRYGITGKPVENKSLNSECLYRDRMILVGTEAYNVSDSSPLERLSELPYVGRREGSGSRQAVFDYLEREGENPDVFLNYVARLETVQAVKEAVQAGLGVSFLPLSVVSEELESGDILSIGIESDPVHRCFYGLENRFLGLTPLLEEFCSYLHEKWVDHACADRT